MSDPFKPIALIALYLMFVLKWGPKLMEGREPLRLHNIIKCYNLFQVGFCAYIMVKGFYHSFGQGYRWFCEPIDYSDSYHPTQVVIIGYLYFVSKMIDLLDTVFFVLRKKQSHVSFLHVYHHAGMVALGWIGTKYLAGGQSVFMGLINSFVHVIMYFYYYLTSVDNKFKQSFWKKYITQLQMVSCTPHFIILFSFLWLTINSHRTFQSADSVWLDGASLDFTFDFDTVRLSKVYLRFHDTPKSVHLLPLFRLLPQDVSQKDGSRD